MMNIRVVISNNEFSDGLRFVSACDIHFHFHVKQEVQLSWEPGGVHGNRAGGLFYLEHENGIADTTYSYNFNQLCMDSSVQTARDVVTLLKNTENHITYPLHCLM